MSTFTSYQKKITFARILTEQDYEERSGVIQTLEGPKLFLPGDSLAVGVEREEWPITVENIRSKYERIGLPSDIDGFAGYRPLGVRWARLREKGEEIPGYQREEGVEYYVVHEGGPTWLVKKSIFEATYTRVDL